MLTCTDIHFDYRHTQEIHKLCAWAGLHEHTCSQAQKSHSNINLNTYTLPTFLSGRGYQGGGDDVHPNGYTQTITYWRATYMHTDNRTSCPQTLKPPQCKWWLVLSRFSCVSVMGSCSGAGGSIVIWQQFLCILSQPTNLLTQYFFMHYLNFNLASQVVCTLVCCVLHMHRTWLISKAV